MTSVSRTPSPGRPGARSISPTQLRSMWRSVSQERGWSHPDDWWSPAVDAVTEAIVTDGDVAERCDRLGLARSQAGVSMTETLEDVFALARLARALQSHPAHSFATPPRPIDVVVLLKSAAVGWAEGAGAGYGAGCRAADPAGAIGATLPDADYLAERLREVAAEAESEGQRLGERYGLVVAALLGPASESESASESVSASESESVSGSESSGVRALVDGWDRTWRMSQLATDLRAVFSSGESIVRIGPGAAVVLTRRTRELATRVGSLRSLIDSRVDAAEARAVRIWLERLPDNVQQAVQLLTDLRR